MSYSMPPGVPVAVVRRGVLPPVVDSGTIGTVRESAVAVHIAGHVPWAVGECVVLIAGAGGARSVAPAVCTATHAAASAAVFGLTSPWRPFDGRGARPYNASIPAEVKSILGASRQQATIVDVSTGGLAVTLPARPGGREIEVVARVDGYSASLPCRLAGHTDFSGDGVLLHLAFSDLTAAQQAFVRQLLSALKVADCSRGAAPSPPQPRALLRRHAVASAA